MGGGFRKAPKRDVYSPLVDGATLPEVGSDHLRQQYRATWNHRWHVLICCTLGHCSLPPAHQKFIEELESNSCTRRITCRIQYPDLRDCFGFRLSENNDLCSIDRRRLEWIQFTG